MHSLQWIIEGNFNHYVKTRMTFTGPRPWKVRPRPGPQPATLLFTSPGPARACKFQARTRPGPQNIIESRPGPAHGLRADPARGPRPGPCMTLVWTCQQACRCLGQKCPAGKCGWGKEGWRRRKNWHSNIIDVTSVTGWVYTQRPCSDLATGQSARRIGVGTCTWSVSTRNVLPWLGVSIWVFRSCPASPDI